MTSECVKLMVAVVTGHVSGLCVGAVLTLIISVMVSASLSARREGAMLRALRLAAKQEREARSKEKQDK